MTNQESKENHSETIIVKISSILYLLFKFCGCKNNNYSLDTVKKINKELVKIEVFNTGSN